MKNNFIIGLGGTGGKIVRSLRKALYQEFRNKEPDYLNIRFLYVDSSREMMAIDDPSWRILGESRQLTPQSQLLITGGELQNILNNISGYPNIQPWIGNKSQWIDILNSIVGETLGGQKRRLGRFLFAGKAARFKEQLKLLAGELTNGGESSVTFHVICGLAGGTGSGSLIDVIAQIRSLYKDPKSYRIVVYALLPEEIPNPNWDTGNYHANGYAALVELNALSVGAYKPCDVAEKGDRLSLPDPFNGCYLFSNKNENGLQVDIDKSIPQIVSDFIFQKLLSVKNPEALKTIERMENAENGDGTPESEPGSIVGVRSKRFLSFGIKRLAVPELEIREYLMYQFARQASLQLRYNNWDDIIGYREDAKNVDYREHIRDKKTLESLFLSDDHITLSRGILTEEINNLKWKPLVTEWLDIIPQFLGVVQQQDTQVWLNQIERLTAQRFDENFRGLGVRKFYETKGDAKKEHVKEIRKRIESELYQQWTVGEKSMYDVSRYLAVLLEYLEERISIADERVSRAKTNTANSQDKVTANRQEWAKVGLLSQVLGKRKSLLDAQAECLRELYTAQTHIEAWLFAKKLLQELVSEINRLITDVNACANLIDDSITEFQSRVNERCVAGTELDLRQSLVRFINIDEVRQFTKELVKDRQEQTRHSQIVRDALSEHIGSQPTFSSFNNKITRQKFYDILEHHSALSSQTAHDNLLSVNRDRKPLLGSNIIEVLEREYSGRRDDLNKFVNELVARAGNYLEFDPQAIIVGSAKSKISQFLIIMPSAPHLSDFVTGLKELFKQNVRGDIPLEIVDDGSKPNEICLLCITNLFPVRYAKVTKFLKERYDIRIQQSSTPDRLKLELHGDFDCSTLPNIILIDEGSQRSAFLPDFLISLAMGLITTVVNPSTGKSDMYLISEDEDGLPIRTKLGVDINEIIESIDLGSARKLVELANKELVSDKWLHADRRAQLGDFLKDYLKQSLVNHNNDFENKEYIKIENATRQAIQKIKTN